MVIKGWKHFSEKQKFPGISPMELADITKMIGSAFPTIRVSKRTTEEIYSCNKMCLTHITDEQ